jgi:hypothetical protein
MGQEARCTVRWKRQASTGDARLESEELVFRGDFRLRIPFRAIQELNASDGELRVRWDEGTAVFELGPAAARWLDRIRNPKSLLDKLGVKPDSRVAVLGIEDREFLRQVRERAGAVAKEARDASLVFLGATKVSDLKRLAALQRAIRPDGAIWVVWPKGRPELKEDHVRQAALPVGLTDVKVVAFSATHSALKLVIPVAQRSARERPPVTVPAELEQALARSKTAKAAFEKMPPSHRREIAGYVAEAKQTETRARRAKQTVEKLASGWKTG